MTWVVLKADLQKGTGFNLLRVQFRSPCQGNVVKKGLPLEGPILASSLWQIC